MKSANPVSRSEVVQTTSSNRISKTSRTWLRVAAFLILVGLFAGSFYLTSSASSSNTIDSNKNLTNTSGPAVPISVNSIGCHLRLKQGRPLLRLSLATARHRKLFSIFKIPT